MKRIVLILAVTWALLSFSCNSEQQESKGGGYRREYSGPDSTKPCGLVIEDSLEIKRLLKDFKSHESLSRNEYEGEIILRVLSNLDMNGFVKKTTEDTIYCLIQDNKSTDKGMEKEECLLQQDAFKYDFPNTKKTVVVLYYSEKVPVFDSIYTLEPDRIVLLGNVAYQ